MSWLVPGNKLPANLRAEVLSAFIYRWTTDNPHRTSVYKCAKCDIRDPYVNSHSADGHTHPTVRMITDEQWLADHSFYVTNSNQLAQNRRYAEPASMAGPLP